MSDISKLNPRDRQAIEACAVNNPAAFLIGRLLRLKCPQHQEQLEYASQAEALTILMRVSRLTREQMAFRLGITVSMLDKASAGTIGGNFHSDTLEKCENLANISNLPVMTRFFHILRIHSLKRSKRGPVAKSQNVTWWDEDKHNNPEKS